MYSKRKKFNFEVLLIVGLVCLTNIVSPIVNIIVGRIQGPEGIMLTATIFQVVRGIETLAFIVLLVVILINELGKGNHGKYKVIAGVNLLLFFVRQIISFLYGIHLSQVALDESKMMFEGLHMGEYFGNLSIINNGIGFCLILAISVLTIIALVGNNGLRENL